MAEMKSEIAGSLVPVSKHQAMLILESVYLWMDLGNFDYAREVAQGAATLFPKTKQVQFALGTIEFNQQKYDKALQVFRGAQRLDPKSAVARVHCAEALIFMGKTAEALKDLQWARDLEDDGGAAELAYRLTVFAGVYEVERGLKETSSKKSAERFELATKAYQLALSFEPGRAEPHIRLGEVYVLVGKNDEARVALEAGLALSVTDEEKVLGNTLLRIASSKVKEAPHQR
jgi:tetratricopeptide (TPR) repeat protein